MADTKPLHIQTNGAMVKDVAYGKKVKLHEDMLKHEIEALIEAKKSELKAAQEEAKQTKEEPKSFMGALLAKLKGKA